MAQRVRIRRLRPEVRLPAYESGGAAAFDLAAAEDVVIEPGRVALVPTGLVIEVPPGFALGIFARSSTPLKRGLMIANGVGIVDSDYCGPADEVKIAVMNFTAAPVTVSAYTVVDGGCAVGVQLNGSDSPVTGSHEHETPPEPSRFANRIE